MQPSLVRLGKMFKDRDNSKCEGFLIGKVVSPLPNIQISIDENIVIDRSYLIITNTIANTSIVKGELVALIPSSNNQTYLLFDKVVTL